jgi:proline iminopeptidase
LGTGNSSTARGPDDYNLAGYAKQGKAILDYFHIHEAVIMGSSWGSMVALHFALHYPQAVSKLILIAGAPSYHFLTEAESALIQYGNSEQQHIAQKLLAGEMTTQTEMQQYFQIMGPLYSTQFKPHYRWPVMDYNLTIINAALRSRYYQFDYRDLLPNIKQPTLIIFGEHDRITPISQAKIMAAGIPHSQLVIVANAGHTIGSDAPETYRQAITQFIKG